MFLISVFKSVAAFKLTQFLDVFTADVAVDICKTSIDQLELVFGPFCETALIEGSEFPSISSSASDPALSAVNQEVTWDNAVRHIQGRFRGHRWNCVFLDQTIHVNVWLYFPQLPYPA